MRDFSGEIATAAAAIRFGIRKVWRLLLITTTNAHSLSLPILLCRDLIASDIRP